MEYVSHKSFSEVTSGLGNKQGTEGGQPGGGGEVGSVVNRATGEASVTSGDVGAKT